MKRRKPVAVTKTPRYAAGNGVMDRRELLRAGAAAGLLGGVLVPEAVRGERLPSMQRPGRAFSNYGGPAETEQDVVRWISANSAAPGNGVSWCPLHELEGTLTPNGLHYERHHNGVPALSADTHEIVVHGLVERPLSFRVSDLWRYPMVSAQYFLECGGNSNAGWNSKPIQTPAGYFHGLVSCSEWGGVPLAVLLDEAGIKPDAHWLIAEGADAFAMNVSLPLEKCLDDGILALYQNGERLRPENGYPARIFLPGWEAVTNVKWVHRLRLTDRPVMSRNETSKYTELLPSGKARMFTYVMDVKSLITSPSSGMRLSEQGVYQLSGVAWSGHGRIARVEVSADGGASWADAVLQDPVLPRCFTRFRLPWDWRGGPATLKSRATDEHGNVQPEREALVAQRGRHGYFHYNAIVSWSVDEDGFLEHVYA